MLLFQLEIKIRGTFLLITPYCSFGDRNDFNLHEKQYRTQTVPFSVMCHVLWQSDD